MTNDALSCGLARFPPGKDGGLMTDDSRLMTNDGVDASREGPLQQGRWRAGRFQPGARREQSHTLPLKTSEHMRRWRRGFPGREEVSTSWEGEEGGGGGGKKREEEQESS